MASWTPFSPNPLLRLRGPLDSGTDSFSFGIWVPNPIPPQQEPFGLAVARRDLIRVMGRLERASEGTGLRGVGDASAWRDKIEKIRDVPALLQVGL